MTIPGDPAVKASGRHQKPLPFVGRVLGHVQLYGERERGGGVRLNTEEPKHREILGPRSLGGAPSSIWTPPPPPHLQVLTAAQSDRAITQAPGRLVGQSRRRPSRHLLEPVGGRLPVKVHCCLQCRAALEARRAGGAAKEGVSRIARARVVGGGQGVSLEGIRSGYVDVT